ncbi:MAG: hypothetical protein DRG78_01815, partial [Epsilonproteobacteria bacterium]
MNSIQRLKDIIEPTVEIPYIKPIHLENLSRGFKENDNYPDIKSSFEFPPKSIDLVIELLFKKEYKKLNFFDIARLLQQLEQDLLSSKIKDKFLFTQLLQELFNNSEKYIQNLIIKIITKIYQDNNNHSFKDDLLVNMNSKEFLFIKLCIKKDFNTIHKSIKNQDFTKELKNYGVSKVLINLPIEYHGFLIKKLSDIILTDDTVACYCNNLLNENNLENLYHQLKIIISLIEKKQNSKNNNLLDLIITSNLGNIENKSSKWNQLAIPLDLKDRYKRLKGLFEFQRFVNIVKYLTSHKDMHFSSDENSSDEKRLRNRSTFWSNYDERFSSVKMWVSEEDYRLMTIDKPVNLNDIKQLKNINNEACVLEFKNAELLIIEFFRLKDGCTHFNSLIFEGAIISKVNDVLNKYTFNINLYKQLEDLSSFTIRHKFLWQGWVDEF